MAKRKRTDVVKLQLRIREALRRRLEGVAKAEERSLNSEIAHRLENSFEQEKNRSCSKSCWLQAQALSLSGPLQ
jgi:hypothetical protein